MSNPFTERAKAILANCHGETLSSESRRELSIELAALLLQGARSSQKRGEKRQDRDFAMLMGDQRGRQFFTIAIDRLFRSRSWITTSRALSTLLKREGVPPFIRGGRRLALRLLQAFGPLLGAPLIPFIRSYIYKKSKKLIFSEKTIQPQLRKRNRQRVALNINHLGEAILGEEEAKRRLDLYLQDLQNPHIQSISIKISTLCSQVNTLAREETLERLTTALRTLYRAAGEKKHVHLDMEEYKDLDLTVALFKKVVSEPEFQSASHGIALQAYIPDSFLYQQELTLFAIKRVAAGGASLRLRIVKGANLASEQMEARLKGWPQAPYLHKLEADANFKRMVTFACQKEHAESLHVGVGSHNLFDISYALLLSEENKLQNSMQLELLEGMANSLVRVLQEIKPPLLLYCPVVRKYEFSSAIAYLVRRLDENSAPENFLPHLFELEPGTPLWQEEVSAFSESCRAMQTLSAKPRRTQNRQNEMATNQETSLFQNEPDTDWSLVQNSLWITSHLEKWKREKQPPIPLVVAGELHFPSSKNDITSRPLKDPSRPDVTIGEVSYGSESLAKKAVASALFETAPLEAVANELRKRRGELIVAMVTNCGKRVAEADAEVSEAIDFVEYYRRAAKELTHVTPRGLTLILSPWNFPCSIPAGGIAAALATNNPVIFKPAPEAALVGWKLVEAFYAAGVSKKTLQFFPCKEDPVGTFLVKNEEVKHVVLTGSNTTAENLRKARPSIYLTAETGGKNSLIVTPLADREEAIRSILQSAFSNSGQKCSALSLLILDKELYDDPHFMAKLKDAAESLPVGSAWDPFTKITPLIAPPSEVQKRALTTLEKGESWLLQPKRMKENPQLFSPGIKLGVEEGSFTHQTELFCPLLGVMRAKNLEEAVHLANSTRYGLTAGLHSLDEREQHYWLTHIEAGNCYINRPITGALVARQPFGGWKASSVGLGVKTGGRDALLPYVILNDTSKNSFTGTPQEILGEENRLTRKPYPLPTFDVTEGEESLLSRIPELKGTRIRLYETPSDLLLKALAEGEVDVIIAPLKEHFEYLYNSREMSISYDYQRYGNIFFKP